MSALASDIDAQVNKLRSLQEEASSIRSNIQVVSGQQNENEMVRQELQLLNDSSVVYKKVGPVLLRQTLDEAKETVSKRLEYIAGEKEKLEKSLAAKDEQGMKVAHDVQKKQSQLQSATAEAVGAIAKEHYEGKK